MTDVKVCRACSREAPQHEIDCPIRIAMELGLDCVPQEELDRLEKFYQEVKAPTQRHKIVFVCGVDQIPKSVADQLLTVQRRTVDEGFHMVMCHSRPDGGMDFDIEANTLFTERFLAIAPIAERVITGQMRQAAHDFLSADWPSFKPRKVDRADTGKHGPYNSYGKRSGKRKR